MHNVETQSELMTVIDKAMCLALENIRTITEKWDKDMCATEVDKLHHLMETIHMIKVVKSMPTSMIK